jgi:hypothetical protein
MSKMNSLTRVTITQSEYNKAEDHGILGKVFPIEGHRNGELASESSFVV